MKYSKGQRVMAWIGIVVLLLLYVISFILGVFGSEKAFPMFMASLLATFFIPAMIYIYQLLLKLAKERRITGADMDSEDTD